MFRLLFFLIFIGLIVYSFGMYRTYQTQHSESQKLFLQGKVPSPLPDGFYKGSARYMGEWKGKTFDVLTATGFNNFNRDDKDSHEYPFKTSIGKGIQDTEIDVLKIDYATSGNPFYIRPILDEIVEIAPGKYLGKLHVRIIPGMPFTLGFFTLEKE